MPKGVNMDAPWLTQIFVRTFGERLPSLPLDAVSKFSRRASLIFNPRYAFKELACAGFSRTVVWLRDADEV